LVNSTLYGRRIFSVRVQSHCSLFTMIQLLGTQSYAAVKCPYKFAKKILLAGLHTFWKIERPTGSKALSLEERNFITPFFF
jgi:hypothetical protein